MILASTAGLLPLTGDTPDYWRLSPDGWRELLAQAWRGADVVSGHDGCLAVVAAQLGLAVEELTAPNWTCTTPLSAAHDDRLPEAFMKVLILCGGYGSRLGAAGGDLPKPMVAVGGKPIV